MQERLAKYGVRAGEPGPARPQPQPSQAKQSKGSAVRLPNEVMCWCWGWNGLVRVVRITSAVPRSTRCSPITAPGAKVVLLIAHSPALPDEPVNVHAGGCYLPKHQWYIYISRGGGKVVQVLPRRTGKNLKDTGREGGGGEGRKALGRQGSRMTCSKASRWAPVTLLTP